MGIWFELQDSGFSLKMFKHTQFLKPKHQKSKNNINNNNNNNSNNNNWPTANQQF